MADTYTAVTKRDGDLWIGWIEEAPGVNCQERTREALLNSLRVTLAEALELNREDAIRAAAPDYTEEPVTVQNGRRCSSSRTQCSEKERSRPCGP